MVVGGGASVVDCEDLRYGSCTDSWERVGNQGCLFGEL